MTNIRKRIIFVTNKGKELYLLQIYGKIFLRNIRKRNYICDKYKKEKYICGNYKKKKFVANIRKKLN